MQDSYSQTVSRRVAIVGLLKVNRVLSSQALAKRMRPHLCACAKTIQRDIQWMQGKLDAPIAYDAAEHGYCLRDRTWTYPTSALEEDARFASLFAHRLTTPLLPSALQEPLAEADRVLLAAGDPTMLSAEMLHSVIQATTAQVEPPGRVFEDILEGWRECRVLRITYCSEDDRYLPRDIEPHALFLSGGGWYIRAWCRLRRAVRSFAMHRCLDTVVLESTFERSLGLLAGLSNGNPFGYDEVAEVVVRVAPEKGRLISEREWFPGQGLTMHEDGSLTLRFPSAPEPLLVRWILAYAPHLTLIAPPSLRPQLHAAALKLAERHADAGETADSVSNLI